VGAQNDDGGFAVAPNSTSDSDMTGATVQALAVVGRQRGAATQRAVAWLRANQNDDGGFGQFRGRPSNAQSTAYAVQGLVAAGTGGATLTRALAYLRGLQRGDGSISYSSTSNQTPVWVTAQALMALDRRALPIAAVPRAERPHHKVKPAVAPAAAPKAKPKRPTHGHAAPQASAPVPSGAAAAPPSAGRALVVDRAKSSNDGGSGAPWWVFVVASVAVLAALFLLRRRLLPARFRRRGPAPS
jgi:squalene-hopene cyclase-like protein